MASLAALRAFSKNYHGLLAASFTGSVVAGSAVPPVECEEHPPKRATNLRRRMTPIGHFSILSETKHNPSICTFFVTLRGDGDNPLSKERLASLWNERNMNHLHPRFHQTACTTWPGYFREEDADAPEHISETLYSLSTATDPDDARNDIRQRLLALQSEPMDLSKSLWHAWIAADPSSLTSICQNYDNSHKGDSVESDTTTQSQPLPSNETLLLFRSHHVLADGASIGAALMDLFDEAEDMRAEIRNFFKNRKKRAQSWLDRLKRKLQELYWFLAGSCQALLYQLYCIGASALSEDPWQQIKAASSQQSSESKRTISWAGPVAPVDQVKMIAQALGGPSCTINDVFVTCVTAALSRQLALHRRRLWEMNAVVEDGSSTADLLPKQTHMNVTVPVHLKGGIIMPGESVGNSLGAFVARVPAEGIDSEARLQAVHTELNFLKQTPAALVSHLLARSLSYAAYVLPPTLTSWMFRKANAGSLAVVTNVRMSPRATHIDGHLVESAYGFIPLPPGLPVGVVVASYNGNMYLSVTAESWAVPDGDEFLRMVLEEYLVLLHNAEE